MKSYNILAQIIDLVDFKVIEPETSGVIKKLREKSVLSMALTARMCSMSDNPDRELLRAEIDFFKAAVHDGEIRFNSTSSYKKGVLYTGPELRKGECLILFFEKIGYIPEKVVFVDDSKGNVEDVHKTLHSKDIPVTCLRYGATDAREAKFDPAVSEKELCDYIGKERYNEVFKELL